jgi:hypothetical protein
MTRQKKNLKTVSVHYKNTDLILKMIKKANIFRVRVPLNTHTASFLKKIPCKLLKINLYLVLLLDFFWRPFANDLQEHLLRQLFIRPRDTMLNANSWWG